MLITWYASYGAVFILPGTTTLQNNHNISLKISVELSLLTAKKGHVSGA
jgi:hypothetical protein